MQKAGVGLKWGGGVEGEREREVMHAFTLNQPGL